MRTLSPHTFFDNTPEVKQNTESSYRRMCEFKQLTFSGFGYMWGGCHADHGIQSGNGGFEVKIVEHVAFDDPDAKDDDGNDLTHISRMGWTVQDNMVKLFFEQNLPR